MRHLTLAIIASAFLVGCATSYQPMGSNGGYEEIKLDENVFRIHFRGNRYTNMERAQDFVFLRAAELTIQSGCNYFAVLKSDTSIPDSTYTRPTSAETRRKVRQANVYSITTTTTGDAYTISTPHTTITVVCFKEKPPGWATIFNATFVAQSIKEKYGIE